MHYPNPERIAGEEKLPKKKKKKNMAELSPEVLHDCSSRPCINGEAAIRRTGFSGKESIVLCLSAAWGVVTISRHLGRSFLICFNIYLFILNSPIGYCGIQSHGHAMPPNKNRVPAMPDLSPVCPESLGWHRTGRHAPRSRDSIP